MNMYQNSKDNRSNKPILTFLNDHPELHLYMYLCPNHNHSYVPISMFLFDQIPPHMHMLMYDF